MNNNLVIKYAIVFFTAFIFLFSLDMKAEAGYEDWPSVFDPEYYASHYQDAAVYSGGDPNLLFKFFLEKGMPRKDQASAEFNVDVYIHNYPELTLEYGMDYSRYYAHYQLYGKDLGYNATTKFSTDEMATMYNVSSKEIANFFDKSVFVGDSIMVGFRNYAAGNSASYMHNSDFFACVSYSLYHALTPVSRDSLQPTFAGKKMNIWDAIPNMDVDRVFIMFGTNDLTYTRADVFAEKYIQLIKKIKEKSPNIDIYIIGMTPVYRGSEKGCLNNANVKWLNEYLMAKQVEWGYTYVNLYENVVDPSGNIIAGYSSDHYVHHNARCYSEAWEKTLKDAAIHALKK